ncbi:hypothetical protein [Micropruina sp.]|uniref:hypothetical protein n=1 Tax=Micropruina sp. TaxID=2737536 RepID=UPI0039E4F33D
MNAQRDLSQSVLQVIFSVFLGLVVTAFVGIGVNTFYPETGDYSGSSSAYDRWRLTSSIILLIAATLVMLLSLVIAEAGPVLANGALLGGLFTMIYAVAIGASTEGQWTRFAVMTAALVVTVGVGWWKFTRGRAPVALASGAGSVLPGEAEARLSAIEAKLDALGRALRD